jgi:hypothetical protein
MTSPRLTTSSIQDRNELKTSISGQSTIIKEVVISDAEVQLIIKYLRNPIKEGVGYLIADWKLEAGITEYIRTQILKKK